MILFMIDLIYSNNFFDARIGGLQDMKKENLE